MNLLRKIVKFKSKHNRELEHTRKCLYTSGECVLITYNEHPKTEGTIMEIRDIKIEKKKTQIFIKLPTLWCLWLTSLEVKLKKTFLYYKYYISNTEQQYLFHYSNKGDDYFQLKQ